MPKGILWAVLQEPIAVPPIYDQGSPHHITLFYDVAEIDWQHLIGKEFEAIALLMPDDIPHKAIPSR